MVNNNLVGGWPTPLKNMKVSWEYDSQYMGNKMFQTTNQMIYSRPWILGMKYDYIWEIVCMKFSMIRYWDVDTFIILHLYRDCIGTWDDHGDQKKCSTNGILLGQNQMRFWQQPLDTNDMMGSQWEHMMAHEVSWLLRIRSGPKPMDLYNICI